ncbi:helix-turn-helix domain-containing protein [Pseudonocardia lacus]|uniref:helix-turn-helix domain-containing protein n=1 Tax=Pseudonocardia lacus TaxID=2835865 RepID=UPI0020279DFA|nr:helix-turn-helix domain-containing protein [Pseudonocardia lacus]
MADDELVERVRALRSQGRSPKDIARATGARPAEVTRIVRELGRDAHRAEAGTLVGVWVSRGWSAGLGVPDDHPDWDDDPDAGMEGLVSVLLARRDRPQRLSVCGYLVDTYCLGVKNALGPMVMGDRELADFRPMFFQAMEPVEAPAELARHLVLGAVEYARTLGFQPHPDFAAVAGHLGELPGGSVLTFGRDGVPTYISGPDDDPARVVRTLTRTVGPDGFHAVTHA